MMGILPTSAHGQLKPQAEWPISAKAPARKRTGENPHPMRTFDPSPCSHLNARLLEANHFEVIKFTN